MSLAQGFPPKIPGVCSDTGQPDVTLKGGREPLGMKLGIAGEAPLASLHRREGERGEWLCIKWGQCQHRPWPEQRLSGVMWLAGP